MSSGRVAAICLALAFAALTAACGGGGGSSPPPPPPPPPVTVTVAPATQNVLLGATQTFTATLTNTTNTAVTWSVNGVTGGNAQVGTIDANGLYRAPGILPSPAAVTIRATSVASPTSSGTATATVTSDVVVSITAPAQNSSVEVGAPQQITKSVTSAGGVPDQNVIWSASGNGCAGVACGTIDVASGLFTAPGILPQTNATHDVIVTATSVADPSKSATLTLQITANFGFTINSPPGNPPAIDNATQFQFVPTFTPVPGSSSNPSPSVNWSVGDTPGGCAGTACGTIGLADGLYIAPNLAPAPPSVTINATPLADPSKARSATLTINTIVLVTISPAPPLDLEIEAQQQFTANVGGTQSNLVTWSITGPGCGGFNDPCGSISTLGPVVDSFPVFYTAPIAIPSGGIGPITITATSVFDNTKSSNVSPTFFSTIQATLLPGSAMRAVNHRQTLNAALVHTSTGFAPVANAVDWTVIDGVGNRFSGGNTTVGQICVKALEGTACTPIGAFSPSGSPAVPFQLDYLAPGSVPAGGTVTIEMRSQADPSKFTTAVVTVAANVTVNVSPGTSTLPISGTQQFSAIVVGAANQGVTWSVNGIPGGNATVGTINISGLYTAPATAPAGAVTVTATSVDDPLQSASGTLTIAAGAFISKISPASITALGVGSTDFTLKVQGLNFTAGVSGSGGSTIVFNAQNLSTTCNISATVCTATVTASSVTSAGDYGVQVVNPPGGPLPGPSNQVALKVQDPVTQQKNLDNAPEVTLTAGNPDATGHDVLVVEPTTAGSGTQQVNVDAIGVFSQGNCSLQGSSVSVQRGTVVDVCMTFFSGGLSANNKFSISGPTPNDITISGIQASGSGVSMTLTVSNTATLGPRTMFVETANREKAALVGGIEVK